MNGTFVCDFSNIAALKTRLTYILLSGTSPCLEFGYKRRQYYSVCKAYQNRKVDAGKQVTRNCEYMDGQDT